MRVESIKQKFPKGQRVKLIYMDGEDVVTSGTCGTVDSVDDIGTIHVLWDNGFWLGLIPDLDDFEIVGD